MLIRVLLLSLILGWAVAASGAGIAASACDKASESVDSSRRSARHPSARHRAAKHGAASNASVADESTDSWLQFRGANGAGHYRSALPLPSQLDLARNLKWKIEVPTGHSSPTVLEQSIVVTAYEDDRLIVISLDRQDGHVLWRKAWQVDSIERVYSHGPATPTAVSDGERLFVVFGSYGVIGLDLDGNILWEEPWSVRNNLFGTAASPILFKGQLIVLASDQEEAVLRSYDPADGSLNWEREDPGPASSWSTPTIMSYGDEPILLIYEPYHLRAFSLANGNPLWSVPGLADEPVTIPQLHNDLVVVTSYNMASNTEVLGIPTFDQIVAQCDENNDRSISLEESRTNESVLSRPDADGQGDHPLRIFFRMIDENSNGQIEEDEWPRLQNWLDDFDHANGFVALRISDTESAPEIAWQAELGVPECPTPIIVNDTLFAVRNGGLLTGIDMNTGEVLHRDRLLPGGPYYASPVYGDDKLFFASERGILSITTAHIPPTTVASLDLEEPIWSTPALSNGELIVRSEHHVWVFQCEPPSDDR